MKINFYLDHPTHSYYEVSINPHKETTPHAISASIFHKLYPPHLHSYSTMEPAFIHVQTGAVLNPHKTFAENGINHNNAVNQDVRIRLKINVLPLHLLPPMPTNK